MIKYANLTIGLMQFKISDSNKIMIGVLIVMTRKGEVNTTASNKYLGEILGGKTEQQISRMLRTLKERKIIKIGRDLGRRQISINKKGCLELGLMTPKREVKNVKPTK